MAELASRQENETSQASAEVKLVEDGMAAADPIRPVTKKTAEVHPLTAVYSQLWERSVLDTQHCEC